MMRKPRFSRESKLFPKTPIRTVSEKPLRTRCLICAPCKGTCCVIPEAGSSKRSVFAAKTSSVNLKENLHFSYRVKCIVNRGQEMYAAAHRLISGGCGRCFKCIGGLRAQMHFARRRQRNDPPAHQGFSGIEAGVSGVRRSSRWRGCVRKGLGVTTRLDYTRSFDAAHEWTGSSASPQIHNERRAGG